MAREKIKNLYLPPAERIEFVSSGCTVLDCCLGGGWALGRVANLVGDKSTSKTGLATEAVINFLKQFPNGSAFYRETEAAFDMNYAASMGMPLDQVDFGDPQNPLITVEDFDRDLDAVIETHTAAKKPAIYVLDSLDALSDEGEMTRDIAEGTYGTAKAKLLSIIFRTVARKLERTQILLLIVSQVRENIDRMAFGEKYKRSGGKSLDFYASQVVWLAHSGTLKRSINRIERTYGIEVAAKVKKNKVAMPHRTCDFPFIFYYGVSDLEASASWLKEVGRLQDANIENYNEYVANMKKFPNEVLSKERERLATIVTKVWKEIDQTFMPKFGKYS